MARTSVVYCVVETSDGSFAVAMKGGDLPDRVVVVLRSSERAQALADELNHAYITGWHDCLIEELALKGSIQPQRVGPLT